jgi:porin
LQQDKFYLLLAAYDGVPGDPNNSRGTHIQFNKGDGVFKALEFGLTEANRYKFALGGWQKTTEEASAVDGELTDKNQGFYIVGEKNLSENLYVFFQYGRADDAKNQLDEYWGGGVRLNNYWVEDDAMGLGAARAHNGLPFLRENPELEESETVWELTYFRPLAEHLNAQTSLYYVDNPSMMPELDNALALGVRLYIEF